MNLQQGQMPMADRDIRERDILVAPNEYAYVQDLTKGDIVLYVGPTKVSLSNTERMIEHVGGRFLPMRGDDAGNSVHRFAEATSSQYIMLQNPPKDQTARPGKGANSAVALDFGRTIVVPGPAEFPLWPGQMATVIDGHRLRENEYLVVRVYENEGQTSSIGTESIIRGTDLSFYVPTTGLEVVPDQSGRFVRTAWRMDASRGLHLRVTSAFEATEDGALPAGSYIAGQDVFVRGGDGFFFPNRNLEVIAEVEAIPLAEKEGIYVRNLETGKLRTVLGPTSYLVDPTKEALAKRHLSAQTLALYQLESHRSDRAPSIYVPPSQSVLVIAPNRREVLMGPQIRVLDYDEELEILQLSTGRPKSNENLLATSFLQVQGNKVSDRVQLKTSDHVDISVSLSYRVSFVGDNERWFAVKNYVGLLCDHLGSIIRAATRGNSIHAFHQQSAQLLRNSILGLHDEAGKRAGRHFEENGMWVYDVEVLEVQILDEEVLEMLQDSQRAAIASTIRRSQEDLRLGDEELKESVNLQVLQYQIATLQQSVAHESESRHLELARTFTRLEVDKLDRSTRANSAAEASTISSQALIQAKRAQSELNASEINARAEAFCKQMESLQPELIATLQSLGNKQLAGELTKNLAPLAILGGDSVAEVAGRLLESLPLGGSGGSGMRALLQNGSPDASTEQSDS
jgi:hypothetical protein